MSAASALNRMVAAGFALKVRDSRLLASPFTRLSEPQRAWLKANKADLVELLEDAETLHKALVAAGDAGLGWQEGTPSDWPDTRLLDAGEVLYGNHRMVNRSGRRFAAETAPPAPPEHTRVWDSKRGRWTAEKGELGELGESIVLYAENSQTPPPHKRGAENESSYSVGENASLDSPTSPTSPPVEADPHATRVAELVAQGWSPWNAEARAAGEARQANKAGDSK